ncbi:IS110 family transposase [Naasia sp. SYSU D00057]|uniref:IS110 family transposase n=1 Tax=Naasia sp. SYSU D00057 TaxID=2817380 RepID=UPI001B30FA81|nr:IS110 family transposase [Naasia sp. SYSU D00057]
MMTNQASPAQGVFVGVDTHRDRHHAAVLDRTGRELADRSFPATPAGYWQLADWVEAFGPVEVAAVEGTSSYGAALTRFLLERGWRVVETSPGDKSDRRRRGKTDTADAFTAARAALSGRATAVPKDSTGVVQAIRLLRDTRRLVVRQQTQIMNQIRTFLVTSPAEFREQFRQPTALRLAQALASSRPATTDPVSAALGSVLALHAARWLDCRNQARQLQQQLQALLEQAAPTLLAIPAIGPDTAAALLVAAGQNTRRIPTEAALAHLFGIAPVPVSSGNSSRFRCDRGGNRDGNAAIHRIALGRLRRDPRTVDYIARTMARGKTKRDAIRLLKRHLVREIHPVLQALTQ